MAPLITPFWRLLLVRPISVTKEDARKHVMSACLAGAVLVAITLIAAILSFLGRPLPGVTVWTFADAAICAALTYGVYRYSRVCAVSLLLYFLAGKVAVWLQHGGSIIVGIPIAIGFGYLFVDGVRGTFAYHAMGLTKR